MLRIRTAVLSILLLAYVCQISLAQNKTSNQKPPEEPLTKLVEKHFANWDRNHDNELDLMEVDHVVEDHSVHGRQAALIVCVRYHLTDKDHQPGLSHQQLLKLVDDHDFIKSVKRNMTHLESINHELFLPTDPDLSTFNQGRLNDCYLLSSIAALAHRNPKSIREMIHPQVTGGFQVVYGDGQKIHVDSLTNSELLLGARLDNR